MALTMTQEREALEQRSACSRPLDHRLPAPHALTPLQMEPGGVSAFDRSLLCVGIELGPAPRTVGQRVTTAFCRQGLRQPGHCFTSPDCRLGGALAQKLLSVGRRPVQPAPAPGEPAASTGAAWRTAPCRPQLLALPRKGAARRRWPALTNGHTISGRQPAASQPHHSAAIPLSYPTASRKLELAVPVGGERLGSGAHQLQKALPGVSPPQIPRRAVRKCYGGKLRLSFALSLIAALFACRGLKGILLTYSM